MAEIFFIISAFPIFYGLSIRRNPVSVDKLAISPLPWYVSYGTTWSPVGPAITAEEAGLLEKCDRANDGEDIIDCVRLSIF